MIDRKLLSKYYDQRIRLMAFFDRFSEHLNRHTNQTEVTVLVQEIFLNDERVCTHAFIQGGIAFRKFNPQKGERMEFTARIGKYRSRIANENDGSITWVERYNIEFPTNIVFLDRP